MNAIERTIDDALCLAAERACDEFLSHWGEDGERGGAWVVITSHEGREEIVRALTARNIHTNEHPCGGIAVHICQGVGERGRKSRLIYEEGCRAFVEVLSADGIEARVHSYSELTATSSILDGRTDVELAIHALMTRGLRAPHTGGVSCEAGSGEPSPFARLQTVADDPMP